MGVYLDVELPGQRSSDCGAHVAEEAVEEQGHFTRSLPPTPAPLVHHPWPNYGDYNIRGAFDWNKAWRVEQNATYRRHERRRSSADRELRPMGTQRLSASRNKQVETESTQNLARLVSQSMGSAVSLCLREVKAFAYTPGNGGSGSAFKLIVHALSRVSWWVSWEELTCVTRPN